MKCSSCGIDISASDRYAKMKCAGCSKTEVVRCQACKLTANTYKCNCGFTGP